MQVLLTVLQIIVDILCVWIKSWLWFLRLPSFWWCVSLSWTLPRMLFAGGVEQPFTNLAGLLFMLVGWCGVCVWARLVAHRHRHRVGRLVSHCQGTWRPSRLIGCLDSAPIQSWLNSLVIWCAWLGRRQANKASFWGWILIWKPFLSRVCDGGFGGSEVGGFIAWHCERHGVLRTFSSRIHCHTFSQIRESWIYWL